MRFLLLSAALMLFLPLYGDDFKRPWDEYYRTGH